MNPQKIWNDIKKLKLSEDEAFKRIYKLGAMNEKKFNSNVKKMQAIEKENNIFQDKTILDNIKLGWDNGLNSICNETHKQLIDLFVKDFKETFPDFTDLKRNPRADFVLVPTYQKKDDQYLFIGMKPEKIGVPVVPSTTVPVAPAPVAPAPAPAIPVPTKKRKLLPYGFPETKLQHFYKLFLSVNKKEKHFPNNLSLLEIDDKTTIKTKDTKNKITTCIHWNTVGYTGGHKEYLIDSKKLLLGLEESTQIFVENFIAKFGGSGFFVEVSANDNSFVDPELDLQEIAVINQNDLSFFKNCDWGEDFEHWKLEAHDDKLNYVYGEKKSLVYSNGHYLIHRQIPEIENKIFFPVNRINYLLPDVDVKFFSTNEFFENKSDMAITQTAYDTQFEILYKSFDSYLNFQLLFPVVNEMQNFSIDFPALVEKLKKVIASLKDESIARVTLKIDFEKSFVFIDSKFYQSELKIYVGADESKTKFKYKEAIFDAEMLLKVIEMLHRDSKNNDIGFYCTVEEYSKFLIMPYESYSIEQDCGIIMPLRQS